jgi:hypothetical protein
MHPSVGLGILKGTSSGNAVIGPTKIQGSPVDFPLNLHSGNLT